MLQTAKQGDHNHVPFIIGGVARETANPNAFIALDAIPTDAAYQAAVHQLFGQTAGDQVLALYPSASYPTPRDAFVTVSTDYRFLCPARQLARAISKSQKEPVYRFVFTHAQSNPPVASAQGAWHGEEFMFIFHSFTSGVSGPFTPTEEELTMSDQIIGYWSRFAATADPNGEDAPGPWFVYGKNADNNGQANDFFVSTAKGNAKKDVFLRIDTPFTEGAGYHSTFCNFFDQLAGDTSNGHGEESDGDRDVLEDDNAGNEPFLTDADLDKDDE